MTMKAFMTSADLSTRTIDFISGFQALGDEEEVTIHPGQLEGDGGSIQPALIIIMRGRLHAFTTAQARVLARGAEETANVNEPSDDTRHLLTMAKALFHAADETDALFRLS